MFQYEMLLAVVLVADRTHVQLLLVDVEMSLAGGEAGEQQATLATPVPVGLVRTLVEYQFFWCGKSAILITINRITLSSTNDRDCISEDFGMRFANKSLYNYSY